MRLASFRIDGRDTYGVALADGNIVDLRAVEDPFPNGLIGVIRMGDAARTRIEKILEDPPGSATIPADNITWHPPIRRPGKICGIAMNNSASNERKISAPDHPAYFLKPASCLIGHRQPLEIRSYYGSVHPEPELAVVIGRTARDVSAGDATEHIFGYTIFDDFTGNGMRSEDLFQYYALYSSAENPDELERREQHLSYAGRYKGTDGFGAMGPWLVTRDEIPDPDNLRVTCKVGGEVVAEDSTRYYNYRVAEIVSFISQFQTLQPGDIVSCGTAFKPSAERKSIHHANLQIVDGPVEVSIEGLGTQEIPVVRTEMDIGNWRLES
jgi:2-keto-4-pentenoate hydratase/2-oxohepta-3-ene-1,7-dioic acid hydratase in catechol pathway